MTEDVFAVRLAQKTATQVSLPDKERLDLVLGPGPNSPEALVLELKLGAPFDGGQILRYIAQTAARVGAITRYGTLGWRPSPEMAGAERWGAELTWEAVLEIAESHLLGVDDPVARYLGEQLTGFLRCHDVTAERLPPDILTAQSSHPRTILATFLYEAAAAASALSDRLPQWQPQSAPGTPSTDYVYVYLHRLSAKAALVSVPRVGTMSMAVQAATPEDRAALEALGFKIKPHESWWEWLGRPIPTDFLRAQTRREQRDVLVESMVQTLAALDAYVPFQPPVPPSGALGT
jgi:hypothetical protein